MTRQAYNDYRGWTLPADENGADEGYLVEYVDGGKSNHPAHTGYISWSPKAVFERAYYAQKGMTFGQALEALKAGKRISRAGWNGKGMYLFLVPGLPESKPPILPCIGMYTATGEVLHGWLASQTDMLVSDWQVVESSSGGELMRREANCPHGMTPRQTAPRVTLADVEASIASEYYFTAREGAAGAGGTAGDALGRLTFCVLVLKNGFMATGKSVCVSAANFNPAVGRQIARENALDEIWPVLGYALLDKLAQEGV